MPNGFENASQQGINPVFQNTNAQQQYLANELRQQNQYTQPHARSSGGGGGMNPSNLANILRNKPAPQPSDSTINPATGQDWSATGSGYAGNGGYGIDSIDSWLSGTSGLDNSALGNYNLSGLDLGGSGGSSLDGFGSSLDGLWQGIGSIGDWFGSLFGSGGALEGVGAAAEEAAPVAAAAA